MHANHGRWQFLSLQRRHIDRAVKNLLDSDVIAVLAKRGFLPRYAFLLDVVRFEICHNCTCEAACYECLKDYSNQSHHEKLDRNSVVQFFET